MAESLEEALGEETRLRDRFPVVFWWLRRATVMAVGACAPISVALALVPERSRTPNATVALGLAVLVSLIAATTDRLAAAVAALAGAVSFDVWFTQPYGSLSIARAQDIETTALLLAVAAIVGQLSARARLHRRRAAETSHNLARVHGVAEMVAAGSPTDQVVLAVASELRSLLRLRECWFDQAFAARPGAFVERNGGVSWGAIRWGFSTLGLPTNEVTLTVEHDGLPLGRFVLLAYPGVRVSEDELVTAVALADQAAAALAARGRIAT
jgi:hypothetical protein